MLVYGDWASVGVEAQQKMKDPSTETDCNQWTIVCDIRLTANWGLPSDCCKRSFTGGPFMPIFMEADRMLPLKPDLFRERE